MKEITKIMTQKLHFTMKTKTKEWEEYGIRQWWQWQQLCEVLWRAALHRIWDARVLFLTWRPARWWYDEFALDSDLSPSRVSAYPW
jgi:hypothetical protein